ncbi:EAL domain-containing protein [Parafrankia sp. EUN1f]|uniref:sensor domain-containing phosphodiesterase n=1 Tax=Parafrankia sp. EUN1f TaxID=102897 RepID=UPI0001C45E96|nr:diguanylate phosphodiesterase [Parafrankia sp. EUN1f]
MRRAGSLYDRILSGELPSLLPDVRGDPRTSDLPVVRELGIGSYAATPIVDTEGQVYGLLGGLSRQPCPTLHQSDGGFLRLLASFLTEFVIDLRQQWESRSAVWRQIRRLLDQGAPDVVFQPVVELATGRVVGVEGLARFLTGRHGPEDLFAAAGMVGLRPELEMAAVRNTLRVLPSVPGGVILTVNASPDTVTSGLIDVIVGTGAPERVAVEITEHDHIGDSQELLMATEALRGHGTHIAVDDVGSCYSGLEQLLHLRPEVIKMDRFITHRIHLDPARRAVAAGLTKVAAEIGGSVVAEGIESIPEFEAVADAGIPYGQGFLLGRPTAEIGEACSAGDRLPADVVAGLPRGPVSAAGAPRL